MSEFSTVLMEIGGTGAGMFDQLDVQGLFTAGGTLNLLLIGGYAPGYGASFTIFNGLAAGYEEGSFTITTNLGDGLYWDTSALGTSGTVSVVPEPGSLALVALGLGGLLVKRCRSGATV